MSRRDERARAIAAIERHGALLVYPLAHRVEPMSLWRALYPRSPMRWDWNTTADPRIADLWHLREELARSNEVVYGKWFRGRATFFSRSLFTALLATYRATGPLHRRLGPDAKEILALLESDSPRSTKELRAEAGLKGKMFESSYKRALDVLFGRMLIVGYGEVDDGAFPSLAVGATRALFEDLWDAAETLDVAEAQRRIDLALPAGSPFARHHQKILVSLAKAPEAVDDDDAGTAPEW